jgi:hypothetical protein
VDSIEAATYDVSLEVNRETGESYPGAMGMREDIGRKQMTL